MIWNLVTATYVPVPPGIEKYEFLIVENTPETGGEEAGEGGNSPLLLC